MVRVVVHRDRRRQQQQLNRIPQQQSRKPQQQQQKLQLTRVQLLLRAQLKVKQAKILSQIEVKLLNMNDKI